MKTISGMKTHTLIWLKFSQSNGGTSQTCHTPQSSQNNFPHTHTYMHEVTQTKNNEGLKAAPSAWVKNRTNIPKTLPWNHCSAEQSPKHKWNLGRKRICEHEDKPHPSHHAEVNLRGKRSVGYIFGWFVAPSLHCIRARAGCPIGPFNHSFVRLAWLDWTATCRARQIYFIKSAWVVKHLKTLRVRCFRWRLFFGGGGAWLHF